MKFDEMKSTIQKMSEDSYEDFIKALISFELRIDQKELLDRVYKDYMEEDDITLLSDDIYKLTQEQILKMMLCLS